MWFVIEFLYHSWKIRKGKGEKTDNKKLKLKL